MEKAEVDNKAKSHHSGEESGETDLQIVATSTTVNVFNQGGKSYRTMNRADTILILFTNQVGLGILSLPGVMKDLGLVPGIITIVSLGTLTWYAAYLLLDFYRRHPHVLNMVDMTKVVGGKWFERVAGVMFVIQLIFYSASATVTLTVVFNAISDHATCTVVFMFASVMVNFLLSVPRTMKFISRTGIPNAVSVLCAAGVALISLSIAGPKNVEPGWTKGIEVVASPSFATSINACLRVMFSFAANVVFVTYMAEMIDPVKDFTFCLSFLEAGSICLYTAVGVAFYCIVGQHVTSPILGAAQPIAAKVAYGLVIPSVVAAAISNAHTAIKYVYVESMMKMDATTQITANTWRSWITWMSCVTGFWIIVFVLCNAIPIFNSIVSVTTATTVPWLTYGFASVFWFHSNWGKLFSSKKQIAFTMLNVFLIFMSVFFNVVGLWSSITELIDIFNADDSSVRGAFSCGNNAESI